MRTREELNKEAEFIYKKIDSQRWVLEGAIISWVVTVLGILCGSPIMFFGFVGMIIFGGIGSYYSQKLKELRREWQLNGYGLKKYPEVH